MRTQIPQIYYNTCNTVLGQFPMRSIFRIHFTERRHLKTVSAWGVFQVAHWTFEFCKIKSPSNKICGLALLKRTKHMSFRFSSLKLWHSTGTRHVAGIKTEVAQPLKLCLRGWDVVILNRNPNLTLPLCKIGHIYRSNDHKASTFMFPDCVFRYLATRCIILDKTNSLWQ